MRESPLIDHRLITFEVDQIAAGPTPRPAPTPGRITDWEIYTLKARSISPSLAEARHSPPTEENIDERIKLLAVEQECSRDTKKEQKAITWWNRTHEAKRRQLDGATKRLRNEKRKKNPNPHKIRFLLHSLKTLRDLYKKAQRKSRREKWVRDVKKAMVTDPWKFIHRVAVIKGRKKTAVPTIEKTPGTWTKTPKETFKLVMDQLIPDVSPVSPRRA